MLTLICPATNANRDQRNNGNSRDHVRCDCGFEFFVRVGHRKSGKVTKCYHCEKHEKRGAELAGKGAK